MTKIAGSRSESGSISQRHGSADPDPDPDLNQNVMDLKHCLKAYIHMFYEQLQQIFRSLAAALLYSVFWIR
jgi:hypothetical protein